MEQLIYKLYEPANQSSPECINEIQKQIQRLQREKSAWQLGLDLLQHEDSTVRFYGALTLTIKINADWWVLEVLLVKLDADCKPGRTTTWGRMNT